MVKKVTLFAFSWCLAAGLIAQSQAPAGCLHPLSPIVPEAIPLLKEINRDIWIPFAESWAKNDVEQFNNIHAADFIRATGGAHPDLSDRTNYVESNRNGFDKRTKKGERMLIDFAFFERIASDDLASERGIYRVTRIPASGKESVYYGRFHCFHKKLIDHWKMVVDYDSDDGAPVTEAEFKAGKAMDQF